MGLACYMAFVVAVLVGLMVAGKRGMDAKVFRKPIAQCFEQLYLFIENMVLGAIGAHGRKYIPLIMSFWMVIFVANVIALFFPASPTADISFNLAMAIMVVGYVQYEGIKVNGIRGHLSHFAGPKLGGPLVIVSGMIFVIEIISELMKNVSLSLRLYGNMHGGHEAVEAMNKLGQKVYLPVGAFLMPIKLLTCVVQAMIFTLLTCVYLGLVTHSADHDPSESTTSGALAH